MWRYNVGKGSRGPAKGKWARTTVGYYVDNSSSGYRVHNNIAIDANEAIRYNDTQDGDKAGHDVWFFNNTFYKCGRAQFAYWNGNKKIKATPDADVSVCNNLAVACESRMYSTWKRSQGMTNNVERRGGVLKDPTAMDFTPKAPNLQDSGIPVLGESIPYVGAVDQGKGMWRYGADESKLPPR